KTDNVTNAAKAYGNAIAKSGQQSQAAHTARQNLINDIIKAGIAANDTKGQIAAMITKVLGIPTHRALQLTETGIGHFTIGGQFASHQQGPGGHGGPITKVVAARGMYVTG